MFSEIICRQFASSPYARTAEKSGCGAPALVGMEI